VTEAEIQIITTLVARAVDASEAATATKLAALETKGTPWPPGALKALLAEIAKPVRAAMDERDAVLNSRIAALEQRLDSERAAT
jgi:hypothetical protein